MLGNDLGQTAIGQRFVSFRPIAVLPRFGVSPPPLPTVGSNRPSGLPGRLHQQGRLGQRATFSRHYSALTLSFPWPQEGPPPMSGRMPPGHATCYTQRTIGTCGFQPTIAIITTKPNMYAKVTCHPFFSHSFAFLAWGKILETATPAEEPNQIMEPPYPTV